MNIDFAQLRSQLKPGWSGVNIAITIVLFWLFWPLALLMVAYILWGKSAGMDLGEPDSLRTGFSKVSDAVRAGLDNLKGQSSATTGTPNADNRADKSSFEQWKREETDKLTSERRALEQQKAKFEAEKRAFESERENA